MTFSSQWVYPSPMNHALRDTFYHEAGGAGLITNQIPIQRFIAAALPNLALHARQNQENSKNAFGREDLPIHVDDNIRPSWVIAEETATNTAIDKVQLDCMMCTKGTEGNRIFSACGDYTETQYLQSTSQLITVTSSPSHHHQLTIPPFSPPLNLPTHACGICVLTTCPHTLCTNQHTIPFPILASRRPNNQPLTFGLPKQILHPRLYVKPKSSRASSSRSSNNDKPSTTILIIIIPIALLLAFFIVFARRMRKVKMQSQPQLQPQWRGPVRVRREEQGSRERGDGNATDIRYSASVLPLSREDEFGRVATPDLQSPPPSYYEATRGQGRRG